MERVAGYFHLYRILWLRHSFVMVARFLHRCRVWWERSGSRWVAEYLSRRWLVWRKADIIFSAWQKCTFSRTSPGTSAGRKDGFSSLWILSMARSGPDSDGTSEEKRFWAYCWSWLEDTDSGTPLNLILFLLDLSPKSAILSFNHEISSEWAAWASTIVLKDEVYSPNEDSTRSNLSPKSSSSALHWWTGYREVCRDRCITFSVVSDTGCPCIGKAVMGSMPVLEDAACGKCAALTSMLGSWRGL